MFSNPALKIRNLTKTYDLYSKRSEKLLGALFPYRFRGPKFTALNNFSIDVHKGECLGIMGVNGSGKSTLLQLISGILYPTSGEIAADGRILSLLELGSWINAEETGRENIFTAGYSQGLSRQQVEKNLPKIIEFAEIGDFIDQPLSTYSTGMMLRLAFATNIHLDADILLLDEVLAVGDARFAQKCMAFIREFVKNKTVLLVSHDTNAIASLCTRGILLSHGQMIYSGDTRSVTERYLEECYSQRQDVMIRNADRSGETKRSFGMGDAEIELSELTRAAGGPADVLQDGETVILRIRAKALKDLQQVTFGFVIKDPCGQYLLGETSMSSPIPEVKQGQRVEGVFEFVLPRLANGEYTIGTAVTTGEQINHTIQNWNHRAVVFRVNSRYPLSGVLMGLPLKSLKTGVI